MGKMWGGKGRGMDGDDVVCGRVGRDGKGGEVHLSGIN